MHAGVGLLIAFAGVAVAGCVGGGGGETAGLTGVDAGGEEAGSIAGIVVDDTEFPVEGATVGILQTTFVTTTDAAGRFSFRGLVEDTYTLAVQRLGYESAAARALVMADLETKLIIALKPIVIEVPFHEIHGPFEGYFDCRLGFPIQTGACGSVLIVGFRADEYWTNDKAFHKFNMSAPNYRTFIGELDWQQGTAATSTALRASFSHDDRTSSHWWCSGEGPSPLSWRFEKIEADDSPECFGASVGSESDWPEPTPDLSLHQGVRVPFGNTQEPVYLALQQRFSSYVSIFYAEPAPEAFTALEDA